jgi:TP901 family phage tail tape measure protein
MNPVEIVIKARDEASSIFSALGSKVVAVGATIAGYFGISAFVGAVKGAADLEAKLSEVKAVSGATAAEMVLLRKAAEDAGATTKFTATEGADALGNLTRAGVSAKDAIAALPAVLQLAQAGGIGLGEASDYVSKTIMGMGLAFTDAGRVADVLAMGANASNTSVTGLAQALSYAAPLAKSLGLSLETTVAIIGKFADAGIDASRAGTALNAIMAQFADPASKFRTELAGAGITTTNFEQALRQLAAAGPAGAKAILAVGTEAGPALRALLNQGIGALDDLKGKLDGAAGSAAKTAAVMEDNLKGSFNSLSSAWDTVKTALATPVLPVLTSGVQSLSKAFSDAVSSGVVGQFGTAIATAFEGGIKWAKAFLAQADFAELATRLQAFAANAQDTFAKVGEAAINAGNIVKTVYGVMSSGISAVMTVVYGLGTAFAGVASNIQSGLALLLDGLSKITFGGISASFKQAAEDVRLSAGATWAASEAFAEKGRQAFIDMANGAELARSGWAGLTAGTEAASTQASAASPAFKSLADSLAGVGAAATDAGAKAQESGTQQQAAAAAAKEKVAVLRAEYEAAVATGNWQLATEKMQALASAAKEATTGTADLKKQAEENAAAIAAAFERMGIKTKAELGTIANVAKQDFERIKDSGQASADGLQAAFKKYAEAAIAANGGVATETIKSEAAMRGLQVQTDSTGKSIVVAMGTGKAATEGFTHSVRESSVALDQQKTAAVAAAQALKLQADQQQRLNALAQAATAEYNSSGATLLRKLNAGTLTSADKGEAQASFDAAKNNLTTIQSLPGGSFGQEAVQSATAKYNEARRVLEATGTAQATTAQQSQTQQPAKTYTVNINLGGINTAINTSSDADAQALIALLQRAKLSS